MLVHGKMNSPLSNLKAKLENEWRALVDWTVTRGYQTMQSPARVPRRFVVLDSVPHQPNQQLVFLASALALGQRDLLKPSQTRCLHLHFTS